MRKAKAALTIAVVVYSIIVCVWYAVSGILDHDEHQFMASSFLVAQYGFQPYQDFAYFHMPNLVYVYSLFFKMPYPFTLARLFVGMCALGICLTIFFTASALFADKGKLNGLIIPASFTILLVHSPLFQYVTHCVWNHTPSVLFAVLAFLLHCRAIKGEKPPLYFFLSGASLGMAIGIRLSLAPLVVPFLVALVVFRAGTVQERGINTLAFGVGGLLANLPAVYFLLTSYHDFIFGNLGYPKLNTLYRQEMLFPTAMTFLGKLKYLITSVLVKPAELLIVLVTLYILVLLGIDTTRNAVRVKFEVTFLLLSLPFVYAGCIAPTPSWYQYYFALIPFLILLGVYAISCVRRRFLEPVCMLLVVAAAIATIYGSPMKSYSTVRKLMSPESWSSVSLQRDAEHIKTYINSKADEGAVLTLSPLYAVMSGLPIYKEFVTGPFAWRVSHLLAEKEAKTSGLPLRSQTRTILEDKRPLAILTGMEDNQLEAPLVREAQQLRYQQAVMPSGITVWLPPQ